jgi:alcohol dehydrogenase class IV
VSAAAPVASGAGLAFAFDLPTAIHFGRGVRRTVGTASIPYGQRVGLVVGRSFETSTAARDVLTALDEAGLAVVVRVAGAGEPDDGAVLALAERLRDARADVVVAVGGGSVLDLGKAGALLPDAAEIERWLAGERVDEARGLPVIALPTTGGSGAEVSHAAIVLHRAARRKRGIRGRGIAARVALVDPELALTAGAEVTAQAGFDAIAHAVETGASRAANPLVVGLSGLALPRLLDAVPAAMARPADLDARDGAAFGALLMGINLASSSTCLPHRLQYPVGALTGTSHARGVAALMPAWLERTADAAPDALARVAHAAGIAALGVAPHAAARALAARLLAHLEATGLRTSLGSLGVRREDVPALVAAVEGSVGNDPGRTAPADLRDLYLASLDDGRTSWTP